MAVTWASEGNRKNAIGALHVKSIQSGLAWTTQNTTQSTQSPLTAGSSHLDLFQFRQGGSQDSSVQGLHSQWARGMCRSERNCSWFKAWRHKVIYLFTMYTGACHFINFCISFLVPWSILGSICLVLSIKKGFEPLNHCEEVSYLGFKHTKKMKWVHETSKILPWSSVSLNTGSIKYVL